MRPEYDNGGDRSREHTEGQNESEADILSALRSPEGTIDARRINSDNKRSKKAFLTLEPDGVTFRFNATVCDRYLDGITNLTVLVDEQADRLRFSLNPTTEGYSVEQYNGGVRFFSVRIRRAIGATEDALSSGVRLPVTEAENGDLLADLAPLRAALNGGDK